VGGRRAAGVAQARGRWRGDASRRRALTFKLERPDGTPAEPPLFRTSVYRWSPGDVIPLTADRSLRVVRVKDEDADQPPVLVVEDLNERG
jgi:hypothetical protein